MKNQKEINTDRILSRSQFRELTGISRSTEWRMQKEGSLPPLVKINGRILGYRASAYSAWLKQNSA